MGRLSVSALLVALALTFPAATLGEYGSGPPEGESRIEKVDLIMLSALGGGYPDRGGLLMAVRLRRVPEVPFALEVGLYAPWGVGVSLLIDVFRNDRLRVHLFDPGIFRSWEPELRIARPEIERSLDVTFGLGFEWRFAERWLLTFDSRFFLPNPSEIIPYLGNFSFRVYEDAAKGVQTWIGLAYQL